MLQAPSEQLAVPFRLLHGEPHAPHADTDESVFVSHPFVGSPSQLPQLVLQVPSVQTPLEHVSVAFARLQTCPQAPQFARLVLRFVSQPFAPLPSQSPSPGLHTVTPHVPLTQFGVPPVAGHTFPHVPQFVRLVWVFTSQPFEVTPSQFA
jgi:hypothetical protein